MNNKQLTKEDVQKAIDAEYAKLENGSLKFHFKCCTCCKAGIYTAAGAAITAAIAAFPEDAELIPVIAGAVGISTKKIEEIITGKTDVDEVVEKICKELNQC